MANLEGRYRRLSDVCDEWLTPIVSIVIAIGALRTFPGLGTAITGLLGSVASFLAGLTTGLILAALILIVLIILATEDYKRKDAIVRKASLYSENASPLQNQSLHNTPENFVPGIGGTAVRTWPPPNLTFKGKFSGVVWTVVGSNWDRQQPVKDFPPPVNGKLKKWFGSVEKGVLTLQPAAGPRKNGQSVEVVLEGCCCSIVTECLGTKTPWWKKGPIEISHDDRELLDGESTFYMICEHGGAKEQWYIVLSRYCDNGDSVRILQELYHRYSTVCHQKDQVPYPYLGQYEPVQPAPTPTPTPTEKNNRKQRQQRGGWLRPWRRQRTKEEEVLSQDVDVPSELTEEGVLNSPDVLMERVWMAGGSAIGFSSNGDLANGEAVSDKVEGKRNFVDSGEESGGMSDPGPILMEDNLDDVSKKGSDASPRVEPKSPASLPGDLGDRSPSPTSNRELVREMTAKDLQTECLPDTPNSENQDTPQTTPEKAGGALQEPTTASSPNLSGDFLPQGFSPRIRDGENEDLSMSKSPRVSVQYEEGEKSGFQRSEMPGGSPFQTVDGIHGLNMFLARWAFDLARNPWFEDKFCARIQKKLNDLRRPKFVNPLNLVSMELGTNSPVIKSARALPAPSKLIWPQILLDISYAGGLELVIETSVDLREASAWNALDKAIDHLGGRRDKSEAIPDAQDELSEGLMNSNNIESVDYKMEASSVSDGNKVNEAVRSPPQERSRRFLSIMPFRQAAAAKAKQLAEKMAQSISKIPLRLCVSISRVEGRLLLWVSPPPSDRLWFSFIGMPKLEITAKPVLANRVMKTSAHLTRVSAWLEKKIHLSLVRSLVYPNCSDMKFPGLLGLMSDDGLRHPGKVLLSELAGVTGLDTDDETEKDVEPESEISPQTVAKQEISEESEGRFEGVSVGENGLDVPLEMDGLKLSEKQQIRRRRWLRRHSSHKHKKHPEVDVGGMADALPMSRSFSDAGLNEHDQPEYEAEEPLPEYLSDGATLSGDEMSGLENGQDDTPPEIALIQPRGVDFPFDVPGDRMPSVEASPCDTIHFEASPFAGRGGEFSPSMSDSRLEMGRSESSPGELAGRAMEGVSMRNRGKSGSMTSFPLQDLGGMDSGLLSSVDGSGRLSSKLGEMLRVGEEGDEQSSAKAIMRAARERAGRQAQRAKEAIGSRTAQLRAASKRSGWFGLQGGRGGDRG